MTALPTAFDSLPAPPSGAVTWIHIGDPHLTRAGEQNALDLGRIVDEINAVYAPAGISFVFVPGDIADDGSPRAYDVFRSRLDRLQLPWCAIVGDHDVHTRNYDPFRQSVCPDLSSAFSVGPVRFLRLNAFSQPRPDSFSLDPDQLTWLERELAHCQSANQQAVLFLHCYPSDLKENGEALTRLLHRYPVLLVDMGHTHYNEISNDGRVLYTATRSTGQIEEGPVGYSVTTVDRGSVTWDFVPLGSPSLLSITSPADHRLQTARTPSAPDPSHLAVRAKIWSRAPIQHAHALLADRRTPLTTTDGLLWTATIDAASLPPGLHPLEVHAEDAAGTTLRNSIRLALGPQPLPVFREKDQDNAIGAWPERGLLGTQLGPNKNGRKW